MLNFKTVYLIEWRKIIKRKEIIALFVMLAIPALYSIGAYIHSSIIVFNDDSKEYGLSFVVNMFLFVKMLFVFFLITALFAAKSLGGEIENRSILLYTQRITNRAKIYRAKIWSLYSAIFIILIIFAIFTTAMYYLFVVSREDIAVYQFIQRNELVSLLYIMMSIIFLYFLVISFSMMLSSFLKANISTMIFCIVFILFTFFAKFPYIKFISFEYYINELLISNSSNTTYLTQIFLAYMIITLIFISICNYLGSKIFVSRDL